MSQIDFGLKVIRNSCNSLRHNSDTYIILSKMVSNLGVIISVDLAINSSKCQIEMTHPVNRIISASTMHIFDPKKFILSPLNIGEKTVKIN